jgi:CheY-like chemotaxis protein
MPRSGSRAADYTGGSETILVVEDDAAVREVTVYFLRKFGYRVLEADGGTTALAVLEREEGTDLLLTDLVMPDGLQGDEIARLVRKRDPNIKVLYCSGDAQILMSGPEKSAPRTDQLRKPYRAKDLAAKVRQLLDREAT